MVKQVVFGEGIIANAYHSAQYARMLSRNATTTIDAVYYNPAGLIKMTDGWHFAAYNQGIFTDKFIETGFPESLINTSRFEGSSQKPVLPSAFAVYKKNDMLTSTKSASEKLTGLGWNLAWYFNLILLKVLR